MLAAQSWIDGKPNTLKAMMRALRKGTDMIANDRPKALEALQKQLRIDADALKVMVSANKYGLAITDSLAASLKFQGEWALEIKRTPKAVTAAEGFAPQLLKDIDPQLVTWQGKA